MGTCKDNFTGRPKFLIPKLIKNTSTSGSMISTYVHSRNWIQSNLRALPFCGPYDSRKQLPPTFRSHTLDRVREESCWQTASIVA